MPITDGMVTEFPVATSLLPGDVLYLIRSGQDYQITAATIFSTVASLFKTTKPVVLGGTPQTIVGAGTVDVTTTTTQITNTGASALAINDGSYDGQVKLVLMTSATGTTTLSGINLGVTSVTFDAAGETLVLFWFGTKWWAISGTATINA